MSIQHPMTASVMLILVGVTQPLLPAMAQNAQAIARIDCRQERNQATEQTVFNLSERIGQDLDQQQLEQANRRMLQMVQTIATFQDMEWRSLRLRGLVNTEESGQRNLWVELINRSAARGFSGQTKLILDEAVRITQSLNSGYSLVKTQTFAQLARDYQKLGNRQAGLNTLALAVQASQTVRGEEFKVNALVPIAEAYIDLGEPATAIALIRQAQQYASAINNPDLSRRHRALAKVAQAYLKAGQIDPALAIAPTLSGSPYVQAEVLLSAVRLQLQQGQRDAAAQLAQSMQTYPGLGAIALVEVAQSYAAQGNPARANALFNQAIQVAKAAGDTDYTLSLVIISYSKVDPNAALSQAEKLSNPEHQLTALTQIALSYARNNQDPQARQTIEKAVAAIPKISYDWQGSAVQHLAEVAIAADAADLAVLLTTGLTDPLATPSRELILVQIAKKTAEQGKLDAALQAIQAIPANNSDARSQGITALSGAYVRANQYNDAVQLVELINASDVGYRAIAQATVGSDLLLSGNTDPGFAMFDLAKQTAASLTDPTARLNTWGAIAIEYARARQEIDREVMQRLRETIPQFGDNSVAATYLRFSVERALQMQQYSGALELAKLVPDPTDRSYQLDMVARQALTKNEVGVVSQAIEQIAAPDVKSRLMLMLIDRFLQDNQTGDAIALLNQAVQVARTIPDPEIRILRFGNEGGTEVDDDADRASSYEAIALRYMKLGRRADALRVAGFIQDRNERNRVTQRLMCYSAQ